MLKRFIACVIVLYGISTGLTGCQPQTIGQKVEDKVEDATHETGQAMERAGENIEEKAE